MRQIVGWTVPLILSLFAIQTTAEALYVRASLQPASSVGGTILKAPVHEVDREVVVGRAIT